MAGKKKPKPKRGRPPKLTPQMHEALINALKAGLKRYQAADACELGRSTFKYYLQRGAEEERGPFRALLDAVKKAESDGFVKTHLLNIAKCAAGRVVVERRTLTRKGRDGEPDEVEVVEKFAHPSWQASAWLLERCLQNLYALKSATAILKAGGKGGAKSFQLVIDEGPEEVEPPKDLPRE